MKLSQYIAYYLGVSRREACRYINNQEILINNQIAESYSYIVKDSDKIQYKNKLIVKKSQDKFKYYIFYKPRGVITSQAGLKYYYKQINPDINNLKYAGRLDKESEGLLILTNDGEFIQALTHPKQKLKKHYTVHVTGYKSHEQTDIINKYNPATCQVRLHPNPPLKRRERVLKFTLTEGKNRQIRKLCANVGLHVTHLKRTQIGKLKLNNLKAAEYKEIKPEQIITNYRQK